MEVLPLIALIGLSVETRAAFAMSCYEEMSYHEKYGYGYDIYCSDLNDTTAHELENTVVYNEIRLTLTRCNLSRLSSTLFQNIPKTREVFIADSRMELQAVPEEGPFANLHQLELLSMANSKISGVSKDCFRNLSNLRVLNVSYNDLNEFKQGTLSDAQRLEVLDLSNNSFESMGKIPLCEVPSLKRLFLASNRLTLGANESSLSCLKLLKSLVLDFNSITKLAPLAHLRTLVKVSLGFNEIRNLSSAFAGASGLQDMNLEGNRFEVFKLDWLRNNSGLKKLNLRNNSIRSIEAGTFAHLTALEDLSLERNNLSEAPVLNLRALRKLSLSHNPLLWEKQEFHNLSSLNFLYLSGCGIHSATDHFASLSALKFLDLSSNKLALGRASFKGLANLLELTLKDNSLLALPDYTFEVLVNLRNLDLSNNKLKQLSHLSFHNLKKLEILNLSYNCLETLAENVVVSLESLSKLDLEGNRLRVIDYDIIISLLSNLKLINIRENRLSCEFLTQMLQYFKDKKINYTISEKLTYNEENVAGISCQEYDALNSSLQLTGALLFNDTKLLNEIYFIAKDDNKSLNSSLSTTLLILGVVLVVLFISIAGISYRIYVIIKRRNCVSDEIELLDTRLHKWNYI